MPIAEIQFDSVRADCWQCNEGQFVLSMYQDRLMVRCINCEHSLTLTGEAD